jgi:6-phosphofructokinase 1
MEAAGPREKLFFDPSQLACGIVTCGGLCPGLNDVIRSIVLSSYHHYGVRRPMVFVSAMKASRPDTGTHPWNCRPTQSTGFMRSAGPFLDLHGATRIRLRWSKRLRT